MKDSFAELTAAARHALDQAQTALTDSAVFDLRDLRVEVVDQSLLISGSVSSYYHKQLAQEAVRAVADAVAVVNSIEVR
jgi:osmotically-inducible protein OsmY